MVATERPIVYTQASCPTCLSLKLDLKRKGVQYEERDVGSNQRWLDEAIRHADTVPIMVHPDGRVEVGFAGEMG
jgi:glutaredoxin